MANPDSIFRFHDFRHWKFPPFFFFFNLYLDRIEIWNWQVNKWKLDTWKIWWLNNNFNSIWEVQSLLNTLNGVQETYGPWRDTITSHDVSHATRITRSYFDYFLFFVLVKYVNKVYFYLSREKHRSSFDFNIEYICQNYIFNLLLY